jgi:hypothetical protein
VVTGPSSAILVMAHAFLTRAVDAALVVPVAADEAELDELDELEPDEQAAVSSNIENEVAAHVNREVFMQSTASSEHNRVKGRRLSRRYALRHGSNLKADESVTFVMKTIHQGPAVVEVRCAIVI